ncbi:MAG: serine/threonine protein kinase [Bryobacter sp.]|nr:serine/threonine protein kinase [Bryobacter sp.]
MAGKRVGRESGMSAEWAEVERVFLDACGLQGAARAAYLEDACAGRAQLRAEVESLLAADEGRGHFLEAPPSSLAADLLLRQSPVLAAGDMVGGYVVRSLVSRGGMGEVYLAEEARTGKRVGLKFLRRHLTADAHAVERFEREARAAGTLRHENLVGAIEFGKAAAGLFLAMEWVEGETLRVRMRGEVSAEQALDWSRQAARGFAAAHEAGILHRDIKPENVMLSVEGVVKILDFGLARLGGEPAVEMEGTGSSGTISGTLSGTLPYLSPELLRGETATKASDVFSFGSVVYELFTGRHPFEGETPLDVFEAIECRTPVAPSQFRSELSPILDGLLLRMLDREPDARPAMADVAELLASIRGV